MAILKPPCHSVRANPKPIRSAGCSGESVRCREPRESPSAGNEATPVPQERRKKPPEPRSLLKIQVAKFRRGVGR